MDTNQSVSENNIVPPLPPPPPINDSENISDVSDISETFYAIWGSLNPDHHLITTDKSQADVFATMFVTSLDLPLTHVTEHSSQTEAEIFLSLQSADRALQLSY